MSKSWKDVAIGRGALALGCFSLALGIAQIAAPGRMARLIGTRDDGRKRRAMRLLGAREIVSGIGILARRQPAGPLWMRVAGDLFYLGILRRFSRSRGADSRRLATATAAVAGIAVVDALAAAGAQRRAPDGRAVAVTQAITVNRPVDEVYAFWRNLENLPRFMAHLESIEVRGGQSRWKAKASAGTTVEWDAIVVEDFPNEQLAWRSRERAHVPNSWTVRFALAPGGRGTEIRLDLRYDVPGGRLGAAFAKLFGEEPSQQIRGDLRRLKQVLETGEVLHSDASIHHGPHPARPPARGHALPKMASESQVREALERNAFSKDVEANSETNRQVVS